VEAREEGNVGGNDIKRKQHNVGKKKKRKRRKQSNTQPDTHIRDLNAASHQTDGYKENSTIASGPVPFPDESENPISDKMFREPPKTISRSPCSPGAPNNISVYPNLFRIHQLQLNSIPLHPHHCRQQIFPADKAP
jgi:hypothetical protein